MRPFLYFCLLLSLGACKNEAPPPEVSEIPEEVEVPKAPTSPSRSIPALPEPLNPSNKSLVLKQLRNTFTMYILKEYVDTTVYHYNTNGEVIAEFSTYLSVGDGQIFSGYKKYHANPENINVPGKIYATVTTLMYNRLTTDFIYCDDQKRVIREVKDGGSSVTYEYDDQGRLSRKVNEGNKEVILYRYFNRAETGEGYDYYTAQIFSQGSSTPYFESKYILSNSIKSQAQHSYLFNYGKLQEYVVEKETNSDGAERLFSYTLADNERVAEKKFRSGKLDFWIKYVY